MKIIITVYLDEEKPRIAGEMEHSNGSTLLTPTDLSDDIPEEVKLLTEALILENSKLD